MSYIGVVEDNDDPLYKGRVKIRVFGKFDQKVDNDPNKDFVIPTDCLPWARPDLKDSGGIGGSGSFSIPKLGSVLSVYFSENNIYAPMYTGYITLSEDVIDEVKQSYKNSHVLLYDTCFGDKKDGDVYSNTRDGEHIKIYFTEKDGLMIDYKTKQHNSTINIDNKNNINIASEKGKYDINISPSGEVNINAKKIYLGEDATHQILKGDNFLKIFNTHIHPGNNMPPSLQLEGASADVVLSKVTFTK